MGTGMGIAQKPEAYKLAVANMETFIRLLVILVLVAIVASLGSALFHLSRGDRGPDESRKMARALTIRIALSLALFALLMIAWYVGLISPHDVSAAGGAGPPPNHP
jgi:cytochrome bd-type quinol oxidase subunit 2